VYNVVFPPKNFTECVEKEILISSEPLKLLKIGGKNYQQIKCTCPEPLCPKFPDSYVKVQVPLETSNSKKARSIFLALIGSHKKVPVP
jgi:hypothetical protein